MREKILTAARELIVRDGYEAVTMRKIGSHIEYSAMALYRHFADKESLLRELCLEDFATLRQSLQADGIDPDPVERLRRMAWAYVEFALAMPNQYRLLFMTPMPREFHVSKMADDHPEDDTYNALRDTLVQAIELGRFRPEFSDADMVAQVIWGGLHGIVSLHIVLKDAPNLPWRPARESLQVMIDTLIKGLTVSP
ncbi:MAG: TetR/AcrR family transcriptional regulator [Isosphaeraceae bacterium]